MCMCVCLRVVQSVFFVVVVVVVVVLFFEIKDTPSTVSSDCFSTDNRQHFWPLLSSFVEEVKEEQPRHSSRLKSSISKIVSQFLPAASLTPQTPHTAIQAFPHTFCYCWLTTLGFVLTSFPHNFSITLSRFSSKINNVFLFSKSSRVHFTQHILLFVVDVFFLFFFVSFRFISFLPAEDV